MERPLVADNRRPTWCVSSSSNLWEQRNAGYELTLSILWNKPQSHFYVQTFVLISCTLYILVFTCNYELWIHVSPATRMSWLCHCDAELCVTLNSSRGCPFDVRNPSRLDRCKWTLDHASPYLATVEMMFLFLDVCEKCVLLFLHDLTIADLAIVALLCGAVWGPT
jgi:hypothetical protein